MKIILKNIISLCSLIIQCIEDKGIKQLNFDIDFYWNAWPELSYNSKIEKPELTISSLIDDWRRLQDVLRGEYPLLSYDFPLLGKIMKLSSYAICKEETLRYTDTKNAHVHEISCSESFKNDKSTLKIKLSDLFDICRLLVEQAANELHQEFEIETDYYWNIKTEESCDIHLEKPNMEKRSLIKDFSLLKKILTGERHATPTDLELLGNIIRFLFYFGD